LETISQPHAGRVLGGNRLGEGWIVLRQLGQVRLGLRGLQVGRLRQVLLLLLLRLLLLVLLLLALLRICGYVDSGRRRYGRRIVFRLERSVPLAIEVVVRVLLLLLLIVLLLLLLLLLQLVMLWLLGTAHIAVVAAAGDERFLRLALARSLRWLRRRLHLLLQASVERKSIRTLGIRQYKKRTAHYH